MGVPTNEETKGPIPIDSIEKGTGFEHEEHREKVVVDESGKKIIVDYSGAHAKTDPEEIKLVRKLDMWIMVGSISLKTSQETES